MILRFFAPNLFLCLFALIQSHAQIGFEESPEFESQENKEAEEIGLRDFERFTLDVERIHRQLSNETDLELEFPIDAEQTVKARLQERRLLSNDYFLHLASGRDVSAFRQKAKTFGGSLEGNPQSRVSLTVNKGFLQILISTPLMDFYLEQAMRYGLSEDENDFIVYTSKDVIPSEHECGVTHAHRLQKRKEQLQDQSRRRMGCLEVELAVAADFLLFDEQGGVTQTENEIIAILNNVQTNYDNEFDDELRYELVTLFISDCSTCDPWTASTDPGTLLDDFTDWGNDGGFGVNHDIGALWSDRNFDGNTIGLAWVGAVCSNVRYHILEHFSNNSGSLRVLWAHEMGHNWDAVHDDSGTNFIMAPSLVVTNTWSNLSESDINSFYPTRNCLSDCVDDIPPVADFGAEFQIVCPEGTVQFFDLSENEPTAWAWSFPGGSPGSSTSQNPQVNYNAPGTYNVTLTASNVAGADSETKSGYIIVGDNGQTILEYINFESGLQDWSISNPDNVDTWELTEINGSTYGSQGIFVENFSYNAPGQNDFLISPILDASSVAELTLELEYAYARYNASFEDNLAIEVSSNGGGSWTQVFLGDEDGSGNFATAPDQTTAFFPETANDWCGSSPQCIEVDISNFASPNLQVRIVNINGHGNNLFLDNIMLRSNCAPSDPPSPDFGSSASSGCVPLTVQYFDQSQGVVDSRQWVFEGGTPGTSTEPNPSITYNTPGLYDVSLTVTNAAGESTITEQNYVNVAVDPIAIFSWTQQELTITFQNLSENGSNYFWDFGDGNTSTEENPVHTYANDGNYQVTLSVSNICGVDEIVQSLFVVTIPEANFDADIREGCAPLTVQFENLSSSNTTSYEWIFEGGNPSTSSDFEPVVVYDEAGAYDVTLISSNLAGSDTVVWLEQIIVNDIPEASFDFLRDGFQVSFDNTSSGGDSFEWEFGDGTTSDMESPTHTYINDGTYEVILRVTNECGADEFMVSVEISNEPTAGFTSDLQMICLGDTVRYFSTSSSNTENWFWEFEGGMPATSTEANPLVVYESIGSFDVSLRVTNGTGENQVVEMNWVEVFEIPVADFDFVLDGLQVDFNNSSASASDYFWNFGDGFSSLEDSPIHEYSAPGDYEVTLIASSFCGSDTIVGIVSIADEPEAGFGFLPEGGCAPITIQFENTSSENAIEFLWTFEGGQPASSQEENPEVIYDEAGTYSVQLIAISVNRTDTLLLEDVLVIGDLPESDFDVLNSGLTVDFVNLSEAADDYFWDFGDGATSTDFNPSHTYSEDGEYTVCLSTSNDCGSDTLCTAVNTSVAPTAGFGFEQDSNCAPISVQFQDLSNGLPDSWLWTFVGGNPETSMEQNPTVIYESPGEYSVKLVVVNAQGVDSVEYLDTIAVFGEVEGDFDFVLDDLEVDFGFEGTGGIDVLWDFGDGQSGQGMEISHTYDLPGEYRVEMTARGPCDTLKVMKSVEVFVTSIDGVLEAGERLRLFPNPASDILKVEAVWNSTQETRIYVRSMLGELLWEEQLGEISTLRHLLDVSKLHSAGYFVHIVREQNQYVVPIVVIRR